MHLDAQWATLNSSCWVVESAQTALGQIIQLPAYKQISARSVRVLYEVGWLITSAKEKFIYMPHKLLELEAITSSYCAMGCLPRCVGSVDCVYI